MYSQEAIKKQAECDMISQETTDIPNELQSFLG